jgi:hypothetical protein
LSTSRPKYQARRRTVVVFGLRQREANAKIATWLRRRPVEHRARRVVRSKHQIHLAAADPDAQALVPIGGGTGEIVFEQNTLLHRLPAAQRVAIRRHEQEQGKGPPGAQHGLLQKNSKTRMAIEQKYLANTSGEWDS